MPKNVLVASPHHAFAELLRSTLVESGRYHVSLAASGEETLRSLVGDEFDLAILDVEIPDQPLASLCQSLLQFYPHLCVMIILSADDPNHLALVDFKPHAYLPRSASSQEVLRKIDHLLNPDQVFFRPQVKSHQAAESVTGQHDATTPSKGADAPQSNSISQHLERLLPEFSIKAAVVSTDERLIACSGDLREGDSEKLFEILERHRQRTRKTDIASFVHLRSRGEANLLYATPISKTYLLATVEDAVVPLSRARADTLQMAHRLASLLSSVQHEAAVPDGALPLELTDAEYHVMAQDAATSEQRIFLKDEDVKALQEFDLNKLLAEIPSPDLESPASAAQQGAAAPPSDWAHFPWEQAGGEADTAFPAERKRQQSSLDETVAVTSSAAAKNETHLALTDVYVEADVVLPWEEEIAINPNDDTVEIATQHRVGEAMLANRYNTVEDTQPPAVAEKWRQRHATRRETVFTCILIPRLEQHALSGALMEMLPQWVAQYCAAFGWKLEKVEVFPEHLQWTVVVTPSVSPGNVVRTVRQRTSEVIFEHHPDLKEHNPSGDYWAPAYLVIRGNQPPTPQLLQDFIDQTRQRQGNYRF